MKLNGIKIERKIYHLFEKPSFFPYRALCLIQYIFNIFYAYFNAGDVVKLKVGEVSRDQIEEHFNLISLGSLHRYQVATLIFQQGIDICQSQEKPVFGKSKSYFTTLPLCSQESVSIWNFFSGITS